MKFRLINKMLRDALCLGWGLVLSMPAWSAAPFLPTAAPLANSTTTTVLPNLMLLLDTSGSMGWKFLPDWAGNSGGNNGKSCRNVDSGYPSLVYNLDCTGQPLQQSPDFNGVYYNPANTYKPPVKYDGTSFGNITSWTAVKDNAFVGTSTTDLTTGTPDVQWCTDSSHTDCLVSGNYILPNIVNFKYYTTQWITSASGTANVVTGTPGNLTVAAKAIGPHYYSMSVGEYCDSDVLTNCQYAQTATFSYPAKLRWCNSDTNASALTPAANSCQKTNVGSFVYARYPTRYFARVANGVQPQSASTSINLGTSNCTNSKKAGIAAVKVGTTTITTGATVDEKSGTSLASDVAANLDASTGYSISVSGSVITVTAPYSAGTPGALTLTRTGTSNSSCTFSLGPVNFSGYVAGVAESDTYYGSMTRTDIIPTNNSYPKAAGRTDCAGATCTYTEEMTNFANWWTYYQTRMQTMKTSLSLAFQPIGIGYRVGFIDLWGNNYLPVAQFDASSSSSAKATWYTKMFSVVPANGTPLRSALARVGRIYAYKDGNTSDNHASDPIQYSCQQNFTLMTTDGYWNTDADADVLNLAGGQVGDQDGGSTPRPKNQGPTATANTLADVAKYYYETDLRDSTLSNCTGAGGNTDVCTDNVFTTNTDSNNKQHMTTFTLGLGVDGTLAYRSDYKSATSGDYYRLANGLSPIVNWPVPVADTQTAVDDLWHAAVNGGGTYFSAKDPTSLYSGLSTALSAIQAKVGAGAAAATSTLNPTAADNSAFLATYTTVKWQGNLEKRTINTTDGTISTAATWCVEDVVAGSCPGGSIVSSTVNNETLYTCQTPNQPDVQIPKACTGTMASKVAASSDTRTIKMKNPSGNALQDFTYANMSTTQKAYFVGTNLSQWSSLDPTSQQPNANGTNMVAYLRGQNGNEMRTTNTVGNRVFRQRDAVTGDFTESQPVFVGKPVFSYTDTGYSDFVTQKTSRGKTVYVGSNDGMLHAYNADDGTERWAYVPSMVMSKMWKLADAAYASNHTNYVNGPPTVADVYDGSTWHTILVGGLNGGGSGYYALDVTDPTAPSLLWELSSSDDTDFGYSYGQPVITKMADGTWVVLLTSGYDNGTAPSDPTTGTGTGGSGDGILFVRNAISGASIKKIATGGGTAASPSGLARISTWADDPEKNNVAGYTYGGDLNGNVWRFDINAGTVMKFALLKDASGNTQPVTTAPALGNVNNKRVIFIGTGKYLETNDLSATANAFKQSIYAIKDDNATVTLSDPRGSLVKQTLTTSSSTRTASANSVDFSSGLGWYIDLPDTGERVNINPLLQFGNLFAPTVVPSNTACAPGGYSWFNYFNYLNGNNGNNNQVSAKLGAPVVGQSIVFTTNPTTGVINGRVEVVTADGKTTIPDSPVINAAGFKAQRVIWRELVP